MNGQTSQGSRFSKWHIEPQREEEQEAWLITYLDMLTLLLVMLVIMLTLAGKGDGKQNEQAVADSMALTAASAPGVGLNTSTSPIPSIEPLPTPPSETEPSEADVTKPVPDMALGDDIQVIVNQGSISFRISSEILFGSGRAELEDAGLDVIDRLVPTLAASRYRVIVEGHTDNLPIQTERFPSNWELSANRASSVVRYLQLAGLEATRLSATGYADTRPIADNGDERGRASNRRVELIMQTEPDSH